MQKGEETRGNYVSREETVILPIIEPYPRPLIAVSRHQLQQKSQNKRQTVPPPGLVARRVGSHPLSSLRVQNLKTYLKDLVTMGIDKYRNRKPILCPRRFAKRYRSTFPVQDDPVHFVRISLSIDEYLLWLKKEHDRRQWYNIATWHSGSPPIPYNLWS